jgi:hypothetical protein
MVVQSPGVGGGFARALTRDWQLAPIVSLFTGQPNTVTTGSDVSLTGVGADRPNVVAGVNPFPNTLSQWFNPAAFAGGCTTTAYIGNPSCVPLGTFGNAGRDLFHNPGIIQWDMSLSRIFQFRERWKMELRADFFNVMNHANWNAPATGLTSSTVGQVTTFMPPRLIQVAMKAYF